MSILLKIFFTSIAVMIASYLLPGIEVHNYLTAILVAAVWAVLNVIVKPLLIFLTIPITIFTLGIFLIFINAIIVLIDAYFVHGFSVHSIWWALLFSLIVSFMVSLFEKFDKKMHKEKSITNSNNE